MALEDWSFYTRTDPFASTDFLIETSSSSPLNGLVSLKITELDTFTRGLVVATLNPNTYQLGYTQGFLSFAFQKKVGTNMREHGIFFLASSQDATQDGVSGYFVGVKDGEQGNDVIIYKMTNGLFDISSFIFLTSFSLPGVSNSDQIVRLSAAWKSGIFISAFGGVPITVSYSLSFFTPFVSLGTFIDSDTPYQVGSSEGFFAISTSSTEILDSSLDDLHVQRTFLRR